MLGLAWLNAVTISPMNGPSGPVKGFQYSRFTVPHSVGSSIVSCAASGITTNASTKNKNDIFFMVQNFSFDNSYTICHTNDFILTNIKFLSPTQRSTSVS